MRVVDKPTPRFDPAQPVDASSGGRNYPNKPDRGTSQPTPRNLPGSSVGSVGATPQPRPVTTTQLADRYKPKAQPVPTDPIATPQPKPRETTDPRSNGRPRSDSQPVTRPGTVPSSSGGVATTNAVVAGKPMLADRYSPAPAAPKDRPRSSTGTRDVRPVASRPYADDRTAIVRDGVPGARPMRPNTAASGYSGSYSSSGMLNCGTRPRTSYFVNYCYGSAWDPCYSWRPTTCWSTGLTFSFGIGYGSFGWGLSSWYPYNCYNSYYGYGYGYGSWYWGSCYTPCHYAPWYYGPRYYWPSYCYVPSVVYSQPSVIYVEQPSSTVVVQASAPQQPAAEVGQEEIPRRARLADREMTAEELAQKYLGLGDFYFRENRFADAADAYARARTAMPTDATLHFALADAVFATGDYHFAAYLITEALRLDPAMAVVDTDKRLLYGDVKLFEQQMATLQKYCEEKPYDAMAALVLGYNQKLSLQGQAAEKSFRRVLEIDPQSDAARLLLDALTAPKAAPAPKPAPSSVEIK